MLKVLMAGGGYDNFSEFAKAKILGDATEGEQRLKDVEIAVQNMQSAVERNHKRWVETAKSVSGAAAEPLIAAVYLLLNMMARPQDKATMDQLIDLELVKMVIQGEDNEYSKRKPTSNISGARGSKDGKDIQYPSSIRSSAEQDSGMVTANPPTGVQNDDRRDLSPRDRQETQLNPYLEGKQLAQPRTDVAKKWTLFGRQPTDDKQ